MTLDHELHNLEQKQASPASILDTWSIIDENEEMPPNAPQGATAAIRCQHKSKQQEYTQRVEGAATANYNACSSDVRPDIDHLNNLADVRRILRECLDTAASSTKLLRIRNEIAGADEAIPALFSEHTSTIQSLPSSKG